MKLAIVSRSVPPYRVHLHRRIRKEIPGVSVWTLVTHDASDGRWCMNLTEDINVVSFMPQGIGRGVRHGLFEQFYVGGKILDWVSRNDIDAVVVWGYADLGRIRTILGLRRMGIPCFLAADSNVRGDRDKGFRSYVKRVLVSWLLGQCTGAMPFGRLGREYFRRYGVEESRLFTAPLEPDYDAFSAASEDVRREAIEEFGLTAGRRRFIFSGRLVAEKQVARLIDAFMRIADERPQWDLTIVGDGVLRTTLEGLVHSGYSSRVRWLGHVSDPGQMAAIYHTSDVLVLPSQREPWGLVVNEAAIAGLAIVCSDMVGAGAELVRQGVNGYVYPWSSTVALSDAMLSVSEEHRIESMKTASRRIVQEWRRDADPVAGLREALRFCGVLE
jgi:glycosyltransferase involved in cell wall biosynthesis